MERLERRGQEAEGAEDVPLGLSEVESPVQLNESEDGIRSRDDLQVPVQHDEAAGPVDVAELGKVGPFRERIFSVDLGIGDALQELGREDDVFRIGQDDAGPDELVVVRDPGRAEQNFFHRRHRSFLKQRGRWRAPKR